MRILIIDKNSKNTLILRKALNSKFIEIDFAETINVGIRKCRTSNFDLVILGSGLEDKQFIESVIIFREEFPKLKLTGYRDNHEADLNVVKCVNACHIDQIIFNSDLNKEYNEYDYMAKNLMKFEADLSIAA